MRTRSDHVDNTTLREAFLRLRERDGLTAADVARRMGLADGGSVTRSLGLRPQNSGHCGHGRVYTSRCMRRDNAARMAYALGLDPVEVGL